MTTTNAVLQRSPKWAFNSAINAGGTSRWFTSGIRC
jgi:hypothetical protein